MTRTERQKLGIKRWIDAGCKGSGIYATGFGKTFMAVTAIKLFLEKKPKAVIKIIVPTQILKDQWENDYIIPQNLSSNCSVEIINSAVKHKSECDLMIIDEAHKAASSVLQQIFEMVSYKMIYCLTGTFERLDGKEEIIKQYAPICDRVTIEEAEANGWVSSFKKYLVLVEDDLTEYNKASRTFNSYFAYFNFDFKLGMDVLQDWKKRNQFAKEMGYTPKECMAMAANWMRALQTRKKFISSNQKKIDVCKKILNARKDKKCITFSSTIADATKIKIGYVMHSKQSKKLNEEIIEKFNKEKTGVLNTSKAADQGLDIKGLSVGIIMNIDSSQIVANQRLGRLVRAEPGKQAEMFVLVLKGTQEEKWFYNSNTTAFTVINEEQLDDILLGKSIESRDRQIESNTQFRF